MENKEIENGLKKRDEAVFRYMIDEYSRLLWTVAGGYLTQSGGCTAEDIEDCVSEVFFELWKNPERYDAARCSLKTYLCMITKNKAISMFRKKTNHNMVYLDDMRPADEPSAEDEIQTGEYSALYEAIRLLQEPTRQIMIRRFFFEEKPASIARALGLPVKKIENCIYRGKQALHKTLSREAE